MVEGIGEEFYLGFTTGAYNWAEPRAGVIAFLVGDFLTDLVLMKSEDNGDTWEKTIIWEHPYSFMEMFTFNADPFYSNDGSITLELDTYGDAHLAFGLTRIFPYNQTDSLWFDPEIGAIAYWHEGMDAFTSNPNALYPGVHPDSELIEDYNLIAWLLDINGDGQVELEDEILSYPTPGMVNMPQLSIDDYNQVGIFFSSITETYTNSINNFRHLWHRHSADNGITWSDFYMLTSDLIHIFDECIYPVATPKTNESWLYTYSADNGPGTASAGQHEYQENRITFGELEKGIFPTPWINTNFNAIADTINENDTVFFINLSIGNPFPDTHFWELEGGIPETSEELEPFVIYPTSGTYDVTLTSSSESLQSTELKEDYITVLPVVDINESLENISIDISPNPTSGIIKLLRNSSVEFEIKILNTSGKIIFKESYHKDKQGIWIDLSNQISGMYFLLYQSSNSILAEKIVIHH